MKKILLLTICLALVTTGLRAQGGDIDTESVPLPKSLRQGVNVKKDESARKVKFLVGGFGGVAIGSATSVEVSPHVGIYPVKWLALGVGGSYIYLNYKLYTFGDRLGAHIFGGRFFVEGYAWKSLVIHASYEYLTYEKMFFDNLTNATYSKRVGTHAVLVGIGYKNQLTERVSIYSHVLFNLNNDEYSLYAIPIFRVGVNVDL